MRQLLPLYGDLVHKVWRAWMLEDTEGRKEIEALVQEMYMSSLRQRLDDEAILLPPPPEKKSAGEYPVGVVLYNHQSRGLFGLREEEWVQHIAVLGRSGSGKTNLVYFLLANLLARRKPFLIFDWKRNYRPIITKGDDFPVRVYTVGQPLIPFHFNPFIPPPKTEPTAWLKKLIEILARATFVGEGVMYLLQQGLDQLYQKSGVYQGKVDRYPTLKDLVRVMEDMPVSGRAANWMASTQRALSALSFGAMGDVLHTQSNAGLAELLEQPVILELDSLTSTDKIFFIESLLLWIHHYRLGQNQKREQFRHAIIIEEAHHILRKQAAGSTESVTDLLLREIRELGESIILVDQHPSLISLPALGNTYTTFTLNLKSREDVSAAGSYLLFHDREKDYLGHLEVGQAIVKLQGRWTQPFLIAVPYCERKSEVIDDDCLVEYMRPYSADFGQNKPAEGDSGAVPAESLGERKREESPLSENEAAFVRDIEDHPFSGVVQRYKRLGLSRRKGNLIKEQLEDKGIIEAVEIVTRRGKVVLFELRIGKESSPKTARNPGVVHEFWRNKIAQRYEQQGWQVTREQALPSGDFVDLVAVKGADSVAIEIETGKSDAVKNAQKTLAAGFAKIFILGTDAETALHLQAKLRDLQQQNPHRLFIGQCMDEAGD